MVSKRTFGSIRALPSGRFQARYNHQGQPFTGPTAFKSRKDASRFLSEVETSISNGTWTNPRVREVRPSVNVFGLYADTWVAQRKLSPRTRALYSAILTRSLLPAFGDVEIQLISPRMVREWFASRPAPA